MIHEFVKNRDFRLFVIPAKAGNHKFKMLDVDFIFMIVFTHRDVTRSRQQPALPA